jgi:hypothetical protein
MEIQTLTTMANTLKTINDVIKDVDSLKSHTNIPSYDLLNRINHHLYTDRIQREQEQMKGYVIRIEESNKYHDSDWWAFWWCEVDQRVKSRQVGTTRGYWVGPFANVDASKEIKDKAARWERAFNMFLHEGSKLVDKQYHAEVGDKIISTSGKYKNKEGLVFWKGADRFSKSGTTIGVRFSDIKNQAGTWADKAWLSNNCGNGWEFIDKETRRQNVENHTFEQFYKEKFNLDKFE